MGESAAEALSLAGEGSKLAPMREIRTGLRRALTAQGLESRELQSSLGSPGRQRERVAGRVLAPAPVLPQGLARRPSYRCLREQEREEQQML